MSKPIAIITGASTGIGRSLAVRFSSKYLVYLISRNEKNLIKTKELIETNNGECKIIIADISKSDSINKIYSQLENKDKIDFENIKSLIFDTTGSFTISNAERI